MVGVDFIVYWSTVRHSDITEILWRLSVKVGDLVRVPAWTSAVNAVPLLLGIVTNVYWDSSDGLYHYRIHLSDGTWTQEQEGEVRLANES
jgi:hypothetical protein